MAKLDYERPHFNWERIRPDGLEENLLIGADDSIPSYIQKQGQKWVFYHASSDLKYRLYATVLPSNKNIYPAKTLKAVVNILFRTDKQEFFFRVKPFPAIPFILQSANYEAGFYLDQVKFDAQHGFFAKNIQTINDYLDNIYIPLLRHLKQKNILKYNQ